MRSLAAALVIAFVSVTASADIQGAWTGVLQSDDQIHLQLTRRPFNNHGDTSPIGQFEGLSGNAVRSKEQTAVTFRLAREAGTFTFEGTFRDGMGGGQFRFAPNSSFGGAIRAMGLDLELRHDQNEADLLLTAALIDVSTSYIRSMQKVFPAITFREAKRARAVGVTPEYITSLRAEGVDIDSVRDATRLAGVGVTVKLIRDLASAGYRNVSVRDLTRLAAHGIDSDYIHEMSKYKTPQR